MAPSLSLFVLRSPASRVEWKEQGEHAPASFSASKAQPSLMPSFRRLRRQPAVSGARSRTDLRHELGAMRAALCGQWYIAKALWAQLGFGRLGRFGVKLNHQTVDRHHNQEVKSSG